MDVSIIIVNWNSGRYLKPCLESLAGWVDGVASETLVVDNASEDGSAGLVRDRFPFVRLLANFENLGFARANNQGVAESAGRYWLFLNPDTTLPPKPGLAQWVAYMDANPRTAVSGCRLLNSDGSVQPSVRRFPTLWLPFFRYTALRYLPLKRVWERRYRLPDERRTEPVSVDQVSGAAMLVRRSAFDDGTVFDPSFFIFYEEVDLCRRMRAAGWEVIFYPGVSIVHHGGGSRESMRADINALSVRSMLCYFRKHTSGRKYRAFVLLFKPLFVLQLLVELLTTWPEHVWRVHVRGHKRVSNWMKKGQFLRRHLADFLFRY